MSEPQDTDALIERLRSRPDDLLERAAKEPIGVDISDYSDEFCEGFLRGQRSILEEIDRDDLLGSREAADALAALTRERDEACPDCGIPLTWCKAVTSNVDHCWRWDYEKFDDMAARAEAAEAALAQAREALREVEWNGYAWIGLDPCPACSGEKPRHKDGCTLAAALEGKT